MSIKNRLAIKCSVIFLLFGYIQASYAGLSLNTTRLILPSNNSELSYKVLNSEFNNAYLVNVRLTKNINDKKPDLNNFIVSPQLFRLNPNGENSIRIRLINDSNLPQDRESVFYVTTSGMPSSPVPLRVDGDGDPGLNTGHLNAGVAFIVKLFYRPITLGEITTKSFNNTEIINVLNGVQLYNSSAHYMDIKGLQIDGKVVKFSNKEPNLIPPFSKQIYRLGNSKRKNATLVYSNDFGDTFTTQISIKNN